MRRTAILAAAALLAAMSSVSAQNRPAPRPAAPATAPVRAEPPSAESAYAAYQRGQYLTAFRLATERVEAVADPASMVLLAELHAAGIGIPQNEERALGWYRLAADRGDRNAIFALGMLHIEGRAGQTRDPALARPFFEKAAGLGHLAAAYNLGLLALGGHGGERNPALAARWFQQAADLGSSDAQYAFAVLLKDGNGIPADLPRAASYMERAAKQDLLEAMIDFAVMLFNGQGTQKDEARAAGLFRRAALRGNPLAMNRYARLLAAGRGTRPDAQKAAQWHMTAHMLGASDAWLQEFVKNMDPVQREAAESGARDWLR
ncbi:MAG: Sel1 repeat-containing protein [Xanthobacteraceae bacterium]|nr:MAG: Sel1 repeat-containing protein [Xanthobacteraceae bacterium]